MQGKSAHRTYTKWQKGIANIGIALSMSLYFQYIHAGIGSIEGKFSAENGAATYTIPIEVSPGTAGVQPEVSLVYNSMSGPGIAGMGWSLSGFSAITRCGQTIFQDGAFAGVEFNYDDKFCLDGQRLVLVNGTYGHNGAEYRTYVDGFSRIKSYGATGNGPTYFIVETKSGQTIEYGRTDDSRIIAAGKSEAFAWAQNKLSDISDNFMTFSYIGNTPGSASGNITVTEYYPSKIEYTGNSIAGSTPYASVNFSYIARNDKSVSYIGGAKFQTTKQLEKIVTKYGADTAFEYRLSYKHREDEKSSLLQSIYQYGNDGSLLPGTKFFWTESPTTVDPPGLPATWVSNFPDNGDPTHVNFIIGDIDGDGLPDLMSTGNFTEKVYRSTGSSLTQMSSISRCDTCKLADINGDGKADLVKATAGLLGGNLLQVALSNGNGFGAFKNVTSSYPTYKVRDTEGYWRTYPYPFDVGDINGDGRDDIVTTHKNGNYIYLSNQNGTFSSKSSLDCPSTKCLLGDFNGDGRADLIARAIVIGATGSAKAAVARSSGSGFNNFESWNTEAPLKAWLDFDVSDINGDGISDLVIVIEPVVGVVKQVLFQKSTGGSFESQPHLLGGLLDEACCGFIDMDADGQVDRVGATSKLTVKSLPLVDPDRITKIRSGMGDEVKIGYGNLQNATVHEMDKNTSHPVYPVRSPILLVTSLEQDNGVGGFSKTTYTYKGLNVQKNGLGLLGFQEMSSTNTLTNAKTVESYSQSFPYIGSVLESVSYRDGKKVSKDVQTPSTKTINHGSYASTLFPYMSRSESIEYDLTSGLELKRTITTQQGSDIDQNGNVKVITTATKSPQSTEANPDLKIVTSNSYKSPIINASTWQLDRLERATVVKTDKQGLSSTRVSAFTYYPSGLLKSEIIAPDAPDSCADANRHLCIKKTTTYEYDEFGNKKHTTVSGYGLTPERTTETYYGVIGRFPEWTKNALLQKESYTHDPICGNKKTLTGPNGLVTKWDYDGFCRKTYEERADGTTTTIERAYALKYTGFVFPVTMNLDYLEYMGTPIYQLDDLNASFYRVSTYTTGAPPVHTYFDRLGREVRNQTVGFEGRIVNQDSEYNALGQIARASRKYYEGENIFWINYQYDALGRVLVEDLPADYNTRAVTRTVYNGLIATVTDPKGRVTKTTKDILGNVVRVEQPYGAVVINRYDPDGNVVETEDAYGNITHMDYDGRGRKLSMKDPDMGFWEYRYNATDELVWQRDAKLQVVTMDYDILGRMLHRHEKEGTTTWFYDELPGGEVNGKGIGKLARVIAPSGYSKTISYDNLGRPETTTTTISGQDYAIKNHYDPQTGRLAKVTRPGNFEVENVYDSNGYLLAMRSPTSQLSGYDTHLDSLKALAVSSASDALAKAEQYSADAAYYEQWANIYRNQVAQNANVQFLTAEVAALQKHKSYKLYINQTTGALYLESPDRVMILHGEIDTPIMIPPEAHYQVVTGASSAWTLQAVDLDTWSSTVLPNLADSGEHVFFGDYNGDEKTDYIRNNQNEENPLYDSALLERLAQTAGEIQYVANTLWNLADNALARANQLIAVAGHVEDRMRQAELWADNSDGDDLNDMSDPSSGSITYWQANTRDAEHRLTGFRQGNGLVTLRDYDPASGHLMDIQTGFEFGGNIRELEYHYDAVDNVTSRHDRIQNVSESFQYDNLDRLKKNSVSGSLGGVSYSYSTDYQYDLTGNILYKSDVGNYAYGNTNRANGNAGPAALRSAGTEHVNYQYDLNGNLEDGGGRAFDWTSFNKPWRLQKGTTWVDFTYGPDRARYLKKTSDGEETVYIGKLYEKIVDGSITTHKHFIYAGDELVAIQIKAGEGQTTQPDQTRYMHTDALGSVDTITDGFGNIVDRMGFDPFGMRRAGNWNTGLALELSTFTNRGFTGHEHVDEIGIIHMNGRIYDPELGRFLSADPHIQSPLNSQSHNRYSYVWNNPLKYTDPSGYFLKWLFRKIMRFMDKWGRTIVAAFMSYGFMGMGAAMGGAIVGGAMAGFMGAAMAGANGVGALRGALFGAVSAWASRTISNSKDLSAPQKYVLHGLAKGVIAKAAGGDARSGLLKGLIKPLIGRVVNIQFNGNSPIDVAMNIAISCIRGGLEAAIGGGKFVSGVVSSAFAHLFSGGGGVRQQQAGGSGSSFFNGVLDVVGKVWALPNTIAGLIYGGVGHVVGWVMGTNPQIVFDHNAIQFTNNPFIRSGEALTLGNTILYSKSSPPSGYCAYGDCTVNIGFHEEAHTYQYQAFGLFYAPAYMLNGGFVGPDGFKQPVGNSFENAAQNYGRNQSSGGWWPW